MSKLFLIAVMLFALLGIANAETNINTASQSELELLQGVGPVKARSIVDYRKNNGLFQSKDDLMEVDGIGAGTLNRLRDDITVGTVVEQNK